MKELDLVLQHFEADITAVSIVFSNASHLALFLHVDFYSMVEYGTAVGWRLRTAVKSVVYFVAWRLP